jgi:hypothetical protein
LSQTAAEPANERGRRGGVAAAGAGGSPCEALVVGGSAEVGDVLLGEVGGELGMHGWTSFPDVVRAL